MTGERLSSLTLCLRPTTPIEESRRREPLGPYLQGFLMEHIDSGYASYLHQLPFNPYSQYCRWDKDELVWRVSALTREAGERILVPLRSVDVVELRAAGMALEVTRSSQETIGLKSIADKVAEPCGRKVRVRFVTPTSFKSAGDYVIMPSVRLVVQNLLMHYGQVYEDNKEGYAETVEYVDRQVRVTSYDLRSNYFGNVGGGRRLPAFTGRMTLDLRGPQMAVGLVRMLLAFGEFSGVGIKTSMGMGGLVVQQTGADPRPGSVADVAQQ